MGADMVSAVVKDLLDRSAADSEDKAAAFAPYQRIIDTASNHQIADALLTNGDFHGSIDDDTCQRRGALLDALVDADDEAAAAFAEHDDLAQKGRDYLSAALPLLFTRECAYKTVGGIPVIVTGGLSWGDDPFEGFSTVESIAALMEATGNGVNPTTVYVAYVDDHGRREQSVHHTQQGARDWVEATLRSRWLLLLDAPAPETYRQLVEKSWNEGRGVSCGVDLTLLGN